MTDDRWSAETEDLVREHAGVYQVAAAEILACLADAGLLLPPGGETREEWGYMSHWRDGTKHVMPAFDERNARHMVALPVTEVATHRTLIRRTVHTTPWREGGDR
jgi:hypothetical protein